MKSDSLVSSLWYHPSKCPTWCGQGYRICAIFTSRISRRGNIIGPVCVSVCLRPHSWVNCLTYNLDLCHGGKGCHVKKRKFQTFLKCDLCRLCRTILSWHMRTFGQEYWQGRVCQCSGVYIWFIVGDYGNLFKVNDDYEIVQRALMSIFHIFFGRSFILKWVVAHQVTFCFGSPLLT